MDRVNVCGAPLETAQLSTISIEGSRTQNRRRLTSILEEWNMGSLKGSKTEDNLKMAFAGESQANRRYLYFAQKADVEG